MELLLNNDLTKNLSNKVGELQENFLKTNWGNAINNAVDSGLKIILPDFIEDEIIDIKNSFVKEGFIEGIKTTIDTAINKGKEIIGMFSGNLEDMTQAEAISKNGGLISGMAKVLENVIDKTVKNGFIKEGLGKLIKNGKDVILDHAEKNIDKVNKEQVTKIKEIEEAIGNWEKAYKNQDFKKMQNEYIKIEHRLEKVMPIEDIINKARKVENLHNLIKNNGKNFDLTDEQKQLAEQLV